MKLLSKMVALFVLLSFSMTTTHANDLNTSDLNFAFGDLNTSALSDNQMTPEEMLDTDGEWIHIIIRVGQALKQGAKVSKKQAIKEVKKGNDVATKTRQEAKSIAKSAGNKKPIREYHPGAGDRRTHYHSNPRSGGHVYYGGNKK